MPLSLRPKLQIVVRAEHARPVVLSKRGALYQLESDVP